MLVQLHLPILKFGGGAKTIEVKKIKAIPVKFGENKQKEDMSKCWFDPSISLST